MATTARPFEIGTLGVRDTTGAVVASAKVRWYNPGTLVAATAYTDAACTTPATAPLTANAAGQFSLYFLEPVRVIIKDSTETTTYYDDIAALNRHDSVYVTHASFNSGAETTLENILTSLGTNLGTDGNYKESSGATARAYSTWLGTTQVMVTDFGATGDGTTDDTTAIQAASDRVEARGGGWVFFPKGTYRINSAINIDTAGVNWRGVGPGVSIIKNYGTTTNAITVNVAGTTRNTFRDFSITANTTSSGSGIGFTTGNFCMVENVAVALHRTGISMSAVTDGTIRLAHIESTDDNASCVGVSLGTRCRLVDSRLTCGSANGTAISASGDYARVVDCNTSVWSTGITASGAEVQVIGCHVSAAVTGYSLTGTLAMAKDSNALSCTTGFSLTGTTVRAVGCTADGATTGFTLGAASAAVTSSCARLCTTGYSVGAFASCKIIGCDSPGTTTDLTVNASATLLIEHSNTFATLSDSATTPHSWMTNRAKVARVVKVSTGGTTPAFTPTPQVADIYICDASAATGSITINATSTTGLVDGQLFTLILNRSGGSAVVPTFNAQYTSMSTFISGSTGTQDAFVFPFVWRSGSASWNLLFTMSAAMDPINGSNIW